MWLLEYQDRINLYPGGPECLTSVTRLPNMDDMFISMNLPHLQLQVLPVVALLCFHLWLLTSGAAQGCCTSIPLSLSHNRVWSNQVWDIGYLDGFDSLWWCEEVKCVEMKWRWIDSELCDYMFVVPESAHLYCTCICLFVWVWAWVCSCACARPRGCVWLSLTATVGTRLILTLIMSERLAMPLSHFSISSILPVRLGYTFLSLFPFLFWIISAVFIPSLCLSHLHFTPQLFLFVFSLGQCSHWCIEKTVLRVVHLCGGGHHDSIVFPPCVHLSSLSCFNVCSSLLHRR